MNRLLRKIRTLPEWVLTRPDLYGYYCLIAFKNRITGGSGASILFAPEVPKRAYAIWKICLSLGIRKTGRFDQSTKLAVVWHNNTFRPEPPDSIRKLPQGMRVLNINCRDISKARVGEIFESVFNRSLTVDPTMYSGKCVEKSNANGTHNGRVIQCPVQEINPESVYQRVIDNQVDLNGRAMVLDYRAVICGNRMPLVYKKYRPVEDRFSNTNSVTECSTAEQCFSSQETADILAFGKGFGVDYAEIDVLRDRQDGQIYIVDVNYTPAGPPNHLPTRQGIRAIRTIATAFSQEFQV